MCGKQRCGEILQPVRQLMAQGESPCRQVGAGGSWQSPGTKAGTLHFSSHCSAGRVAQLLWAGAVGGGQRAARADGDDVWPLDSFRELGIQQQTRQAGMASQ